MSSVMKRDWWTAAIRAVLSEIDGMGQREAERHLAGFGFSDSTLRNWQKLAAAGEAFPQPRRDNPDRLRAFMKRNEAGADDDAHVRL